MPGRFPIPVSFPGFRIVAITFHPLEANRFAVARPRPDELPVIKMVSAF
jgi:hypothetical protein